LIFNNPRRGAVPAHHQPNAATTSKHATPAANPLIQPDFFITKKQKLSIHNGRPPESRKIIFLFLLTTSYQASSGAMFHVEHR